MPRGKDTHLQPTSRSTVGAVVLLLLLTVLQGCGNTPAQQAAQTRVAPIAADDVRMPPRELLEAVKQAVTAPPMSLSVVEQDRGTILTDWKRYRGEWHIGRHWQERTRYRITVAPDFDEPLAASRVSVIAETEQRAAEGQRWDREPRVPRPQRAENALKHILNYVRAPAGE